MPNDTVTKDQLIENLLSVKKMGWVKNRRPGNAGGVGNTLEDLLGIQENNLPIPNAAEWELKCQRADTTSLTTLFHLEPSPTAYKWVPKKLLPLYGWPHKSGGQKYPKNELSFRQTITGARYSDRGFKVIVNRPENKIEISFNASFVDNRHFDWLESVKIRANLDDFPIRPYWGFNDLYHKAGTKLHNAFYVLAERIKKQGEEYFYYSTIMMLRNLSLDGFLSGLEEGILFVDFDARTGHNHGTKFRIQQNKLDRLYNDIKLID